MRISKSTESSAADTITTELINRLKNSFNAMIDEYITLKRAFKASRIRKTQKLFNKIITLFESKDRDYTKDELFWDLFYLRDKLGLYYFEGRKCEDFRKILRALLDIVVTNDPSSTGLIDIQNISEALIALGSSPTDLALQEAMFELVGWKNLNVKKIVIELP